MKLRWLNRALFGVVLIPLAVLNYFFGGTTSSIALILPATVFLFVLLLIDRRSPRDKKIFF